MSDTITQTVTNPTQGVTENQAANQTQAQPSKPADLVTRVSQYKPQASTVTPNNVTQSTVSNDGVIKGFDFNKEVQNIKDPAQRQIVETAYKNMLSHANNTYQELAKQKKDYETKIMDMENWTPERLQNYLNNPSFQNSVQQLSGKNNVQQDSNSLLSEQEIQRIREAENKAQMAMTAMQRLQQQQEDNNLANKYANYSSSRIDQVIDEMRSGRRIVTREDVFKSDDYESAIDRAYKMGHDDGLKDRNERINSSSFTPLSNGQVNSSEKPQPEQGESNRDFFKRVALNNLMKMRQGNLR